MPVYDNSDLSDPCATHAGKCSYSETLACVLDFVFGTLRMHSVFAVTGAENAAAAALFRRVGFRQKAHFIEHRWDFPSADKPSARAFAVGR